LESKTVQSGTAFVQQQHLESMAYSTTKEFKRFFTNYCIIMFLFTS